MDLHDAIDLVYKTMASLPGFPRLKRNQRRKFSVDLALVLIGVRTAYLADAFCIQESVFSTIHLLLERVSKSRSTAHVYDPGTGQSFFINIARAKEVLRARQDCLTVRGSSHPSANVWTSFISLAGSPKAVSPPLDVIGLLGRILSVAQTRTDAPSATIALGGTLTPVNGVQTLVPLAGLLLEYPVSYVPGSAQQGIFLETTPLDVYEVILHLPEMLHHPGPKTACSHTESLPSVLQSPSFEHSLMKFSCPSALGRPAADYDPKLHPTSLCHELHVRYTSRIAGLSILGARVHVKHHTEVKDRVAL